MQKFLAIVALCILSICVLPAQSVLCWLNVNQDFSSTQPLVLQSAVNDFLYPAGSISGSLRVPISQTLRVACPADNLVVLGRTLDVAEVSLRCYGLTFFDVVGTRTVAPFKRIRCTTAPVAEASFTATNCTNGTIAQVGFNLQSGIFVPTIDQICFNQTSGISTWAHNRIIPAIRKRQRELTPPAYAVGAFYPNITMSSVLFTRDYQRTRLQTLLGSTTIVNSLIPLTGNNYLVEGMLVPRLDMFYRLQQDSTYFYINVVPMWRSVRDGNWRLVERITRRLASNKKRSATLDVYTGTIGTLSLNDANGTAVDITLTTDTNGTAVVPVPQYLFKYVVDTVRNRALVFIALNNPRATSVTDNLCTVYASCQALFPLFNTVSRGYTYCCTVDSSSAFFTIAAELGLPTYPTAQPITFVGKAFKPLSGLNLGLNSDLTSGIGSGLGSGIISDIGSNIINGIF